MEPELLLGPAQLASASLAAQAPPRDSRQEPAYRQPIDAGLVGAAIRERRSIPELEELMAERLEILRKQD